MKWPEKPVYFSVCCFVALLLPIWVNAETTPEMATTMRESGKIYVVVGVVVLIFSGILAYLLYMEKRLRKLEQDN